MTDIPQTLQLTSLHAAHVGRDARMVAFAGWDMPVQYTGIMEEHQAVRTHAGVFDVSHMGEIVVEGPRALGALQRLVTNDVGRLDVGRGLYTPLCYPTGGIVDDVTVFRIARERYLLIVNAATTVKDHAWIEEHRAAATVRDISREMGLIAVQGPAAKEIVSGLTAAPVDAMRAFDVLADVDVAGRRVFLSRTGYTGEDGFEIGPSWDDASAIWDALFEAGAPLGLAPAGLGARDTLRLEAGFMLYDSDIDETTSPLEAPLGWTIKWDKGDFIGRDVLAAQRERGPARKLVGLTMEGRAVARHGHTLHQNDREIGVVTSGTFSPTLQRNIALGYVPRQLAAAGTDLDVEVRGRRIPVQVVRLPFYRRQTE